ncbi:hypothetical protein LCGC14_1316620 [marine sediment metagenome]|uniref:Smf/DprA SLOG domain-containing protein n=1 Tax=marine sediment metagenome TaxID=412755 RepID=A0A0F9N1K0_9ZZZZ
MIILEHSSLSDYIFLSREVSLPLSVMKIIKKNDFAFNEIVSYSEKKFESFLQSLKTNYNAKIRNFDEKIAKFREKKRSKIYNRIDQDLRICKSNQIKCFSYFDSGYPTILKSLKQPPKLIFMKGEIKPQDFKSVAIIGTRNPTKYGKEMARAIAKRFAELGFTVVSGFAKGIDTIAMESALENGGRAIGVIASGILNLYPKENKRLVKALIANGALISERFPYKSVTKRALQIRNRITSGLGLGNIVVEGNKFSGTQWQLRFGDEQGKPAIAVEPIGEYEQAYVPNKIIKEKGGAKISDIDDVDYIGEMLLIEYEERKQIRSKEKNSVVQANLLKY